MYSQAFIFMRHIKFKKQSLQKYEKVCLNLYNSGDGVYTVSLNIQKHYSYIAHLCCLLMGEEF